MRRIHTGRGSRMGRDIRHRDPSVPGSEQEKSMNTEVKVHVDMTEVEEYISKAKELERLLKEAKSLADDLASVDLTMEIKA